jgi:hypothetical protein
MRDDAASRRLGKWRGAAAIVLSGLALALVVLATRPAKPPAQRGKMLSVTRLDLTPRTSSAPSRPTISDRQISNNWRNAPNASEIEASGVKPGDDRESAILMRLPPGHYTAITRGVDRTIGIGLAEVYNLGD